MTHPSERVRPGREITGMAAVLLPYHATGEIDWAGLVAHIERTAESGLVPAVNMDTGYGQLLDADTRRQVLDAAARHSGGGFVAGAHVDDEPGAALDLDAYRRAIDDISARGGTPVIFPSYGLAERSDDEVVEAHRALAGATDRFLAFELSPAFSPAGRIYGLEAYRALVEIPQCVGAKHSSLSRAQEWDRLALRDEVRPGFMVLTGNDLAIDMVTYGSDYLLGLATFAPDLFAFRDACWASGDPAFYELDDRLQFLGNFAFRDPVPAYRHDAAMFLRLRGWIGSDATPPGVPRRPESDLEVLAEIGRSLGVVDR